eukprot:TRINITY_DN14171_c0_g1_i3.p1 TRINITY_DN14171_c0_g1~~TRINITY_DN14171_c0_g1_i3.p1  ORF type:complete len:775 (+),score=97.39 TRINITY_DN14171_c0_g1_i3:126-2450(+)
MAIRSVVIGQSWVSLVFLFDSLVRWAAVAGDVIAGTLDSHSGGLDIWVTSFSDSSFNDSTPVADSVWTDAFSRGVDALRKAGGGVLRVPAGTYHTGPFNLTSNMVLWLAADANLVALTDRALLPVLPALPSYGPAWGKPGLPLEAPAQADFRDAIPRYQALIYGTGLTNVTITGENGTIDGKGAVWWERWLSQPLLARPHLIQFEKSREIRIHNVTLRDPGFWSVHLWRCEFVHVHFLTILVPYNGNVRPTNTDGVNPDSSSHILIEDSYLQTGDDAIAIKSGWDCWGRKENVPSTNITVRRVIVRMTRDNNAAGVAVGSEMSGGILNVIVENCHFIHVGVAVEVKVALARGGYVRNVVARDLVVEHTNRAALVVMASYPEQSPFCDDLDPPVPLVDGVTFERVKVLGPTKGKLVSLRGAPRVQLRNIIVRGVVDHSSPSAEHAFNRNFDAWDCGYVSGVAEQNSPPGCQQLVQQPQSQLQTNLLGGRVKTFGSKCPRPSKWCRRGNMIFSYVDCDQDGIPDPRCIDDKTGRSGFLSSLRGCTDSWPRGGCTRPRKAFKDRMSLKDHMSGRKWRNDGRCGQLFGSVRDGPATCPTPSQYVAESRRKQTEVLEPWLAVAPCCSLKGWCGNGSEHCCVECVDYRRQQSAETGVATVGVAGTRKGVDAIHSRDVPASVGRVGSFHRQGGNRFAAGVFDLSPPQVLAMASLGLSVILLCIAMRWRADRYSRSKKLVAFFASICCFAVFLNCAWFMHFDENLAEVAESEAIQEYTIPEA